MLHSRNRSFCHQFRQFRDNPCLNIISYLSLFCKLTSWPSGEGVGQSCSRPMFDSPCRRSFEHFMQIFKGFEFSPNFGNFSMPLYLSGNNRQHGIFSPKTRVYGLPLQTGETPGVCCCLSKKCNSKLHFTVLKLRQLLNPLNFQCYLLA